MVTLNLMSHRTLGAEWEAQDGDNTQDTDAPQEKTAAHAIPGTVNEPQRDPDLQSFLEKETATCENSSKETEPGRKTGSFFGENNGFVSSIPERC